tara:strand:- start:1224 stop:3392 length:2169 start_codon:yes stop_codon:yes gene_type:complete
MFDHAFSSYMKYAYPADELKPLTCTGRWRKESNRGDMDDVMGDYSLTLIDSLSTIAVMGTKAQFEDALWKVVSHVKFDADYVVSVFEVTIRVLGSLLSAHMLAASPHHMTLHLPQYVEGSPFLKNPLLQSVPPSPYVIKNYTGELLHMAVDLGHRLLPAYTQSPTGIPYSRVNLRTRTPVKKIETNCLAGAGSVILEMAALSRLSGNPAFELAAKKTICELWSRRSLLNLIPNLINVKSGEWKTSNSGIGAGSDSFYEYLLKGYIFLDDRELHDMFQKSYDAIMKYNFEDDWYLDVHAGNGKVQAKNVDSLQMFWPGVQVMHGDVGRARAAHDRYYGVLRKYKFTPESFSPYTGQRGISLYPLRPELAESTYMLYKATGDNYYRHVAKYMIDNFLELTKVKCGFAAVHNVGDSSMRLEDTMDSFFIAETVKYLYLIFYDDHPLHEMNFIFTTEGHIFPIHSLIQKTVFPSTCSLASGGQYYSDLIHELSIKNDQCIPVSIDMPFEPRTQPVPLESLLLNKNGVEKNVIASAEKFAKQAASAVADSRLGDAPLKLLNRVKSVLKEASKETQENLHFLNNIAFDFYSNLITFNVRDTAQSREDFASDNDGDGGETKHQPSSSLPYPTPTTFSATISFPTMPLAGPTFRKVPTSQTYHDMWNVLYWKEQYEHDDNIRELLESTYLEMGRLKVITDLHEVKQLVVGGVRPAYVAFQLDVRNKSGML